MEFPKKSLEWLEPLALDEKEARKLRDSLLKPLSKTKFEQQNKLFKSAAKLAESR